MSAAANKPVGVEIVGLQICVERLHWLQRVYVHNEDPVKRGNENVRRLQVSMHHLWNRVQLGQSTENLKNQPILLDLHQLLR